MAAKDRLDKASEAARMATGNHYVHRLIEDEDLRSNLMSAYGAARSAYGRLSNGKPATEALLDDKKLHEELGNVIGALREATGSLREAPEPQRKRRRGVGRSLVLAMVGGTLAIALNKSLRAKLLDTLFGAEEKFDYTSTTAPSTAAEPAGMASA